MAEEGAGEGEGEADFMPSTPPPPKRVRELVGLGRGARRLWTQSRRALLGLSQTTLVAARPEGSLVEDSDRDDENTYLSPAL